MTTEELSKRLKAKHGDTYGILPPPVSDREGLEILIEHFLGEYISVNPISREQYNTEAIYRIIEKYSGKKENRIKILEMFERL